MRPVIDDEKGTTGMRTWTDAVRVAVGIRLWRIGDAVIGGRLLAAAARLSAGGAGRARAADLVKRPSDEFPYWTTEQPRSWTWLLDGLVLSVLGLMLLALLVGIALGKILYG